MDRRRSGRGRAIAGAHLVQNSCQPSSAASGAAASPPGARGDSFGDRASGPYGRRDARRLGGGRVRPFRKSVGRDLLQFATNGVVPAPPDLELPDQLGKPLALLGQRPARGGRLLGHRGVLLRDLIHLVDGAVDLLQAGRLFLGARRRCRRRRR